MRCSVLLGAFTVFLRVKEDDLTTLPRSYLKTVRESHGAKLAMHQNLYHKSRCT